MNKISEEDLILYHYEELSTEKLLNIKAALESDDVLRSEYDALIKLLEMSNQWQPAPVDANFEQRMWESVDKGIEQLDGAKKSVSHANKQSLWNKFTNWFDSFALQPLPALSAIIVLVSVAYLSGRHDEQSAMVDDPTELIASLSPEARNNILFQSVTSHLERSSRFLTTVSLDTNSESQILDSERDWAKNLLLSNRLFSKAAEHAGQQRIVSLLDELEPLLIEMANSDVNSLSSREQIQKRIKNQKLVFKTKAFKANQNSSI